MSSEPASTGVEGTLFVGTHGHVVALCKQTGKTLWDRSLPSTGYSVAAIVYEEGRLFCAAGGRVFALDPKSGEILWENPLRGLGMGLVFLTTANSNNTEALLALLAQSARDAQQRAHSSAGG